MPCEHYGADLAEQEADPGRTRLSLPSFQTNGVFHARKIIDRFGGVIIADEVCLGKTYLAGELVHRGPLSDASASW